MSMRIAQLHRCSLARLDDVIPPAEYPYWVALYELEPWGYRAQDYHAGVIAAAAMNASGRYELLAPKVFMDVPPTPSPLDGTDPVEREIAEMKRVL